MLFVGSVATVGKRAFADPVAVELMCFFNGGTDFGVFDAALLGKDQSGPQGDRGLVDRAVAIESAVQFAEVFGGVCQVVVPESSGVLPFGDGDGVLLDGREKVFVSSKQVVLGEDQRLIGVIPADVARSPQRGVDIRAGKLARPQNLADVIDVFFFTGSQQS